MSQAAGYYQPSTVTKSSVHKRTRVCLACGEDFDVNPCHADEHRFCSPRCRAKGYRQRTLDLEPLAAMLPPVQDQRVPRAERRRLGGMSRRIIDLLRARGPVTNREWADLLPPGAAWRTRVSDARKWLERTSGETIRCRVQPGGLALYWIEAL